MYDFIFIIGAQGSGKTTLAKILKEELNLMKNLEKTALQW
jgi:adenylate kinase family enzyme